MIQLHFALSNPFGNSQWRNLWNEYWIVTCYKTFEIQLARNPANLFGLDIDLRWRGFDHAGPEFGLTLFGFEIIMSIKDVRHWNKESNTWQDYGYHED